MLNTPIVVRARRRSTRPDLARARAVPIVWRRLWPTPSMARARDRHRELVRSVVRAWPRYARFVRPRARPRRTRARSGGRRLITARRFLVTARAMETHADASDADTRAPRPARRPSTPDVVAPRRAYRRGRRARLRVAPVFSEEEARGALLGAVVERARERAEVDSYDETRRRWTRSASTLACARARPRGRGRGTRANLAPGPSRVPRAHGLDDTVLRTCGFSERAMTRADATPTTSAIGGAVRAWIESVD